MKSYKLQKKLLCNSSEWEAKGLENIFLVFLFKHWQQKENGEEQQQWTKSSFHVNQPATIMGLLLQSTLGPVT